MGKVKRLEKKKKMSVIGMFFLLPTLLFAVGEPIFVIIGILSFIICMVSCITFFQTRSDLLRICHNCEASLKGCSYDYKQVSSHKNSYGDTIDDVEISVRCPKCGHINIFRRSYLTYRSAQTRNGFSMPSKFYNLYDLVKKDMDKLLKRKS